MNCGAVIVAAGRHTRIEQLRERTEGSGIGPVARIVVNFQKAGVKDIVLVYEEDAATLEEELRNRGIIFLRQERREDGKLIDFARIGLRYLAARCDRIFVCPADIPFFTDATVREEMRTEAMVVLPCSQGKGGHPLLIDRRVLPHFLDYRGEDGLRGAYKALPEEQVVRISVEDSGAVMKPDNADNEQELESLAGHHDAALLRPELRVRLSAAKPFFGPGTVTLLRQIDVLGSVREACEKTGISYSKGWGIIRRCEEELGCRIVERQPGGRNGGTASVSEWGHRLMAGYESYVQELERYAEERFRTFFLDSELLKKRNRMQERREKRRGCTRKGKREAGAGQEVIE